MWRPTASAVFRRFAAAGFRGGRSRSPSSSRDGDDRCGLRTAVDRAAPVYGLPAAHDGRGGGRAVAGRGRGREPRRAARLPAAVGPVRPGRRTAEVLPLVPAWRGRTAAARHGLGIAARRRTAAADVADQCRAWAMAGPGFGHRSLVAVATLAVAVTIVAVRRTALCRGRVTRGTANGDGPVVASET